jgi:serine protease
MRHQFLRFAIALLLTVASAISASAEPFADRTKAAAPESNVIGLIVKFDGASSASGARVAGSTAQANALRATNIAQAAQRGGVGLNHQRTLSTGAEVLHFDKALPLAEAQRIAVAVASAKGVRYAVPNRTIRTQATPVDPLFTQQWGYQFEAGTTEGANFVAAWDITKGVATQTLGIVDGGIAREHVELASQLRTHALFPNGGYDFMTDPASAADGDGRDDDPQQALASCGHGTHVAGTVAAKTSFSGTSLDGGVAGGAPLSKLLIARALNTFGTDADAIDAMLWLAGESIAGVAVNPNPAKVINMSFGGSGACGGAYQDAFDTMIAIGTVPVVAAGNDSGDVSSSAPANCRGAIAVAASNVSGNLASFSNRGAGVAITAPGEAIYSTGGTTSGACFLSGTSMAAPHVTAAVGLLQAVSPTIAPSQVQLALRAGSRAFPASSNCPGLQCGAGLLDARGSLDVVLGSTSRIGWNEQAATVLESDAAVTFSVSRVGNLSQSVSATIATVNGTATSGVDFGAPSPSTVSWAVGDGGDKVVTVPIVHRAGEQASRSFSIAVTNPAGGATVVAPSAVTVRINDVDCATVTPISMGQTLAGDLGIPNTTYCHSGVRGSAYNTVRYSFSGTAGDIVSIDLTSTTIGPPVLDTYVYLLDPNRAILTENDDIVSGKIRNSRIRQFTLTTTGTHYIDATTWSPTADATGTFNVRLYQCGDYVPVPSSTCNLDVDGDSIFDSTDALLALRRLAGFSGDAVAAGVSFRACATRTTGASVGAFVDAQSNGLNLPLGLDIDGDGVANAATDGLLVLRAALGVPGATLVFNAVNTAGSRTSWNDVRTYLNQQCGLSLAP